jgi:hypothetical protein
MCQAALTHFELWVSTAIAPSSRKVVRIAFSVNRMSSVRPTSGHTKQIDIDVRYCPHSTPKTLRHVRDVPTAGNRGPRVLHLIEAPSGCYPRKIAISALDAARPVVKPAHR